MFFILYILIYEVPTFLFFDQHDIHVHREIVSHFLICYNIVATASIIIRAEVEPPIHVTFENIFKCYQNLWNEFLTHSVVVTQHYYIRSSSETWLRVVNSFLPPDHQMTEFPETNSVLTDTNFFTDHHIALQREGYEPASKLNYVSYHGIIVGDFYYHPTPQKDESRTITRENINTENKMEERETKRSRQG